jgi:hypothetical protein
MSTQPLRIVTVALALAALGFPAGPSGAAEGKPAKPEADGKGSPKADKPEDEPTDKEFSFGAGALGFVGADFLDKASDRTIALPNGQTTQIDFYPGFGGVIGGGGFMLEARYRGFIGLEIDILRSSDHGKGDITISGFDPVAWRVVQYKFTVEIGQSAWHLPLLVKGTVPLPVVRPSVFFGPELVFPGEPSASVSPPIPNLPVAATVSGYTMLTGGIGVEIKLPIPGVDVRIPISFRGSINPSISSRVADRMVLTWAQGTPNPAVTQMTLTSQWKYQTQAVFGAAVWF